MKRVFCSMFFLLSTALLSQEINCDYIIDSTQVYVDASGLNLQPGDTICLECGHRPFLQLKNFQGDSLDYITLINYGGQILIKNDTFYGFVLNNCKYFYLSGAGHPSYKYGIKVGGTGPGSSGLSLDNLSTNFEVDHVEVCNTGFAGIMSKTNPRCDLTTNRGFFTQYNTVFHDNYVHHTGGEGFYIGHSYYNGWPTTCNGEPDTLFPHDVVGLRVYDNIIDSTAYDAVQIDCAVEDCKVYNNMISYYGLADDAYGLYYGMTGIVVGGGSSGDYFNNVIADGKGSGFFVFGLGDVFVYNNLILRPGRNSGLTPGPPDHHHPYGIFCDDRTTIPGKSFNFINNHIISPRDIGIRIWSLLSEGNRLYNNFVLDPGVKDWNIPRAFIDVIAPSGTADTLSYNNHLDSTSFELIKNTYFVFADTGNYKSKPGSPLINAGIAVDSVNSIDFDFENVPRPQGEEYDVGCYEFPSLPQNFGILPLNPLKCAGEWVHFWVPAVYHLIYDFQWLKDDNILEGAHDSALIILDLSLADSGYYSVVLSNGFDADTSLPSFLSLHMPALVYAGSDTIICNSDLFVNLYAQLGNDSVCWWATTGDGWFDPENDPHTTYYPGEEDRQNGGAFLSLNAYSWAPCQEIVSDTLYLGIDPCPGAALHSCVPDALRVYPNPARQDQEINIEFNDPGGDGSVMLWSDPGNAVFLEHRYNRGKENSYLKINGLSRGVYFLLLNGTNLNMVTKLIVL